LAKKIPDDIRFKRGLLSKKHILRMGSALPLYLFFVDRQTDPSGLVWYGRPITYEWISMELGGFPERRLRRWNERLQLTRYIAIQLVMYGGMRVQVLRPKKFAVQTSMPFPELREVIPVEKPVEKLLKSCAVSPFLRRPKTVSCATENGHTKDTGKEREKRKSSGGFAAWDAAACAKLCELQSELANLEAYLQELPSVPLGMPDSRVDPNLVRQQIRETQIQIDDEIEKLRGGKTKPSLPTLPAASPANPVARFEDVLRNDRRAEDRQGRLEFLDLLKKLAQLKAV
jgi:hypothetical protein